MIKKLSILVCFFVFPLSLFAVQQPQNNALIELRNQTSPIKPKEFYIANVTDARKNTARLGTLQPYKGGAATAPYVANIKGGTEGLAAFIKSCVTSDRSLRPVIVTIKELSVKEEPSVAGAVKGSVRLNLAFALRGTYDPVELTTYSTTTTYQRPAGPAQYLEMILNQGISNGVIYFDNWINSQAGTNIKLAKSVRLSFTDYDEKTEGDTIYYNTNRPLTWGDFTGRAPKASKHGAEVFSYIGYNQYAEVKNGVVKVKIALKSWVAKSASWVLPGMQTAYALNHEQRHFDLTRLIAEHFKNKLKTTRLTPDSFEGELNMAYLDALRELYAMQKQYDDETAHSSNLSAQQAWDNRIDKELAASGIKR